MSGWADFGMWEARHGELLREAEERRLARRLREARKKTAAGGLRKKGALLGVVAVPFSGLLRKSG